MGSQNNKDGGSISNSISNSSATSTSTSTSTNTTSSVTYLRFMFIGLSIACLMQISYQYGGGIGGSGSGSGSSSNSIFGCTTIYYVGDGSDSSTTTTSNNNKGNTNNNLRKIDPDVPMNSYNINIKKKKKKKKTTTTSSTNENESIENIENEKENENEKNIPKFIIDPIYKNEQNRIDYNITNEERCKQFGVDVLSDELLLLNNNNNNTNKNNNNKRRIFFGSMLANENIDVILAHAIEVYNMYDIISLVESNTTHFNTPRKMNYYPNSNSNNNININASYILNNELFGFKNKTNVYIDYWLKNESELLYMQREVEQRNTIWERWIKQGMKSNDIGIMADLDEIVSRDFLNSLLICDYPKLRYDPNNPIRSDCQTPKMVLSSIQFEGSPKCIKQYEWFHPDLILGDCILGVGDNSGRVTPKRSVNKQAHGKKHLNNNINKGNRIDEWGTRDYNNYPKDVIDNKRFPLWDGRDIREVNGNSDGLINYVHPYSDGHTTTGAYGTAYHLHNWFNDLEVLRHKYATYGHANKEAISDPLSKIQGDLDTLVRCNRNLGNNVIGMPDDAVPYYIVNDKFHGNRPIFFKNLTYVKERNELVTKLIYNDEKKYKSYYP